MKLTHALAAVALAGAVAMPAASPVALAQAPARDWTKVVTATPEGGFRIGNPDAPLKLVEYGSLTCPHCAHFAKEGVPKLLQNYVKGGRVSFEIRNFVRDSYDLTAALLSRCAGPQAYFPMTHQIFATQPQWTGRFGELSASEYDALEALPQTQKLIRIASIGGLDVLAAKHGVTAAKARACLADGKAVERLTEIRKVAVERFALQGTPTFVINGKTVQGASDWGKLEPLLKSSGG
jgi:protein-disulfide isomerase